MIYTIVYEIYGLLRAPRTWVIELNRRKFTYSRIGTCTTCLTYSAMLSSKITSIALDAYKAQTEKLTIFP